MTKMRTYKGGVWADQETEARAFIGGVWVEYGPDTTDPGDQSLFADAPTGISEDGVALSQGVRFKSSMAGVMSAGRWWFGISPPTSAKCALYRVSDQVQLGSAVFTVPGDDVAWNLATYTSPIPIVAETWYMAVCWTQNRYPYTPSYAWPRISGDLTADASFFTVAGDLAFPTSTTSLNFNCDVVFHRT